MHSVREKNRFYSKDTKSKYALFSLDVAPIQSKVVLNSNLELSKDNLQ